MTAARRRDRRTILCVDGQVGIRQMVRRGLERKRYRVMLARHGAAGLKLLLMNPGRIDVVVSDVVIPRVGQATRFLFTSAQIGGDALAALRSRPGTAFFAKPWTISELETQIRKLLKASPLGPVHRGARGGVPHRPVAG